MKRRKKFDQDGELGSIIIAAFLLLYLFGGLFLTASI